jgi:predicted site-specific integrase-resolvase
MGVAMTARSDGGGQDLLTPKQAAEILNVSIWTLQSWRTRGVGPAWTKLGAGRTSRVRYRRADVERFGGLRA